MLPATGKPQVGGEEAAVVAEHEEGRPPDERCEHAGVRRASFQNESREVFDEVPDLSVSPKWKRNLDSEERHPPSTPGLESGDEEIVGQRSADAMGPGPSDTTRPDDDSEDEDSLLERRIGGAVSGYAERLEDRNPMEIGREDYRDLQAGKSEHPFQLQRAWLVHSIWASVENVRKMSSTLLVNKGQCEHIADHFEVTGEVFNQLGLGKGFVSGDMLGGGGIHSNLAFDETRFDHIAQTFGRHVDEVDSSRRTEILRQSEKFVVYEVELPAVPGLNETASSVRSKMREDIWGYYSWANSRKEIIESISGYRVEHLLDEFLCFVFAILKRGEDLVQFHLGLEGANHNVVERTGLYGGDFVQIHELLYEQLDCYACLEHCEGTEFASGYSPHLDSCVVQSVVFYLTANYFQRYGSLEIDRKLLGIGNNEVAMGIAKVLKDPNCRLKELTMESRPDANFKVQEFHDSRLVVISALCGNEGLTSFTLRGSNGTELRELCNSLRANRVLEKAVISIDEPLADIDAMDLSAMLKENHSLKSFTLEFGDVSPEGLVHLEAMLSGTSPNKICFRSREPRGLRRDIEYLLGLSIEFVDGKRNGYVALEDRASYFQICRSSLEGRELPRGKGVSEQLLVHKRYNHLSTRIRDLDADATCGVLRVLKESKTPQFLELDRWQGDGENLYRDREVVACLEALLAEDSCLTELKVKFRATDKSLVKRLLRCLSAGEDGKPPVNMSLRKLQIINDPERHIIFRDDWNEVVECMAEMLRANKLVRHFSLTNARLRARDVREFVSSLKINKVLEVLDLGIESQVFSDREMKFAFIDLLVNYNFTLRTIVVGGVDVDIETFMERELGFDTGIALRGLRGLVSTTSDCSVVRILHDLEQVGKLQLDKGWTAQVSGSSKMASAEYKPMVEGKDERPRIILSYSLETRDFAMKLFTELRSSNYIVSDQHPIHSDEVVDQCQLAIVVLSDMYLNSESSMPELRKIIKSKMRNNAGLKIYPLFYCLALEDPLNADFSTNTYGGERVSSDIALESDALNFLFQMKKDVSGKAIDMVKNLRQRRVGPGKFCEEFIKLQRTYWPSNGLEFEKNAISEEGYLQAILEEIFHYMPAEKEGNGIHVSGPLGKLEVVSKLSLHQMKSLLESLPMRNFSSLRKFNMAEDLQEKYILYSSFDEMCPDLSDGQKLVHGNARIAAALFPSTFLYHAKVYMLEGSCSANLWSLLNESGDFVKKMMEWQRKDNGSKIFMFFDFVDRGAPLDPEKKIFSVSQNFSEKRRDGFEDLVVVQDVLTEAYYYQSGQAVDPGNPRVPESIGVIGVRVTSEEIYIDNIHEDGSSYYGVLGDFSYQIDSDGSKQCAAKAFGHLRGARFLSESIGIKCSPLLIIALASAVQRKGLTLTWRNGEGHMEFYRKLAQTVQAEVEIYGCQIQYTSNVNELGVEVEWGTDKSNSVSEEQRLETTRTEIVDEQPLGSDVDAGVAMVSDDVAASSLSFLTRNEIIAAYSASTQHKTRGSVGLRLFGHGFDFAYEGRDGEAKQIAEYMGKIIVKLINEFIGGYYLNARLRFDYPDLRSYLLNGQLHAEHRSNYLVVTNVYDRGHVSVYLAIAKEALPKTELTWITDILIEGGEAEIDRIFKMGLKGPEMIVRRDGTNFNQFEIKPTAFSRLVNAYQTRLSVLRSIFLTSSSTIPSSMTEILESGGQRLISKNDWTHIIGPQREYGGSDKYWWNATPMESIVYSRTKYTSGKLLKTRTETTGVAESLIGFCSIEEGLNDEFLHFSTTVISRGKFSRFGSLSDSKVLWGGYEIKSQKPPSRPMV